MLPLSLSLPLPTRWCRILTILEGPCGDGCDGALRLVFQHHWVNELILPKLYSKGSRLGHKERKDMTFLQLSGLNTVIVSEIAII